MERIIKDAGSFSRLKMLLIYVQRIKKEGKNEAM
jgi:hypothetical protein